MRIVYDDTQAPKAVVIVDEFMRKHLDVKSITEYSWGTERVQSGLLKSQLNKVLQKQNFEIGKTVTHANGIGNNCRYPLYFQAKKELQKCCFININHGLYGECYVYLDDYNEHRISSSYEIRKHGLKVN